MNALRGLGRMLVVLMMLLTEVGGIYVVWQTVTSEYEKRLGPFIVMGSLGFIVVGVVVLYIVIQFLSEMGQPCEKKP